MLEQWEVFLNVLIDTGSGHPEVYELIMLLDVVKEVNARLRVQAHYQPVILAALRRLIQTEFKESCREVLISVLPVQWTRLKTLTRTLATGNIRPESFVMPDFFQELTRG